VGVPTSEVGYTTAMPRREDHEVHKDMWWHKKTIAGAAADLFVKVRCLLYGFYSKRKPLFMFSEALGRSRTTTPFLLLF
jgi:hypothetical protein